MVRLRKYWEIKPWRSSAWSLPFGISPRLNLQLAEKRIYSVYIILKDGFLYSHQPMQIDVFFNNNKKDINRWAVAWFLWLNTLPNTTQFSTFYYFLLQYYFSSSNIYYLLLIFNYFFLFILNHTRLLSPRFLHFILLNFITSSSTLLHLCFAFLS